MQLCLVPLLCRSDIPTLWVRVDPDHAWIRQVTIEQPDTVWCMMLKYERDPNAQIMVCCVNCVVAIRVYYILSAY